MKLTTALVVLLTAGAAWVGYTSRPQSTANQARTSLRHSNQDPGWATFDMQDLVSKRAESGRPWLPFLDVSTLSAGLYVLAPGAVDRQQPHKRDEVYYIIAGKADLEVEGERQPVGPGSVVYVKAGTDHRFANIAGELRVLVFFSATEPS